MRWQKITIVGLGLLGGSLGMAIKRARLAARIEGYARRQATVDECRRLKVLDRATLDLHSAVSNADLVILCTPLAQMQPLVKEMLPALKRGAIVTDVGSVKASVVKDVESLVAKAGAHFVGSHPMAGGEKTGFRAARVDLFSNAVCVVTPTRNSNRTAVRRIERFWQSVGGRIMRLTPERHDALVSRSSHLPHLLAATLAARVLDPKPKHARQLATLCATGFRDTTRVASGSPEMWRDIAMANRSNLVRALDGIAADLKKLRAALHHGDAKAIEQFFTTAKNRRDHWCAGTASPSLE